MWEGVGQGKAGVHSLLLIRTHIPGHTGGSLGLWAELHLHLRGLMRKSGTAFSLGA